MFIFQSKRLFCQGTVSQFWGVLVSYGEKIGYIALVSHYLPGWACFFPDLSRVIDAIMLFRPNP